MRNYPVIYSPLVMLFIVLFVLVGAFLFALVEIGVIGYTLGKIGIAPRYMFSFLFVSVFGSFINIPLWRLPQDHVRTGEVVSFYGFRHVIPAARVHTETVVAVNVGGALVPAALSLYLLSIVQRPLTALLAVAILSVLINRLARPIPGLGIAVPTLIPPVLAALTAIILAPANSAAVAYIGGTMGSLIGADILNLPKIRGLRAPVVSIGGAGTFDGIFLTGILAVLLASL